MTKRLSAVVGEYTKEGQQKAEWANIGIIGVDKNGKEYVLLEPSISLSGVLAKQNVLAQKRGEQPRDMVMTSVFEDAVNQSAQQPQYSQAPQQGGYQAPHQPPQGSYQPPHQQRR